MDATEHASARLRAGKAAGWQRRPRCLVCLRDRVPQLERALLDELARNVSELEFSVRARGCVDAVWVCGFEPGAARRLRALRARHPRAILVVTHRASGPGWQAAALAAGADHALAWPTPTAALVDRLLGIVIRPEAANG